MKVFHTTINYNTDASKIFYNFSLAKKHFQVAFASKNPVAQQALRNQAIVLQQSRPESLIGRVLHIVIGVLEIPLIIGLIVAFVDKGIFHKTQSPTAPNGPQLPTTGPSLTPTTPIATVIQAIRALTADEIEAKENRAIEATPQFNSYNIGDTQRSVTSLSLRPANLFLESLNVGQTTMPGGDLYRFIDPLETVLGRLNDLDENQVITVSCNERRTYLYERRPAGLRSLGQANLQDYFGNGRYNISVREIRQMLQSQRIHVSPLIPREFYLGVKNALIDDGIVTLPGNDGNPMSLHEARRTDTNLGRYLQRVVTHPGSYGFSRFREGLSLNEVMNLTLYQLGSMIVKTEDYHCFVGNGFQIADREVGDRDEIRLISACGIRGFYASSNIEGNRNHEIDQRIMKQTFKTAIESVGEGSYIIFPAVGMGVWRGDPNVYWRAFLDAVLELRVSPQKIFINPGHQSTHGGPYRGRTGDEFAEILRSYLDQHPENENLRKVVNLYRERTDLLLFAKNLKAEFPEKTVGIFNASDPDVTLGNHVGEYVNNRCHASTTEENFTALGSNGLCFEALTQVLAQPERVVQAR